MNSKVKGVIKAIVVYSLLIIVGTSAGYGIVLGYNKLNEPKIVLVGDYGEHFKNTDKKVVMYGTDWCPVCKRTRDFFAKEGIEYKELNPEKDSAAFQMYSQLEANGYPVFVIGNKRIFGLEIDEIKSALAEEI